MIGRIFVITFTAEILGTLLNWDNKYLQRFKGICSSP